MTVNQVDQGLAGAPVHALHCALPPDGHQLMTVHHQQELKLLRRSPGETMPRITGKPAVVPVQVAVPA